MDKMLEDVADKSVCRLPEEILFKAFIGDSDAKRRLAEEEAQRVERHNEYEIP